MHMYEAFADGAIPSFKVKAADGAVKAMAPYALFTCGYVSFRSCNEHLFCGTFKVFARINDLAREQIRRRLVGLFIRNTEFKKCERFRLYQPLDYGQFLKHRFS